MASSSPPHAEAADSVYPSYESLRAGNQVAKVSVNGGKRLFWTLSGPLSSAISVMSSPSSTPDEPREPLYVPATDSWHDVALLPISDPKISSITVGVYELNEWLPVWNDEHSMHTDPPCLEDGGWDGDEGWRIVELEGGGESGRREWKATWLAEGVDSDCLGKGAEWRIAESEEEEGGDADLLRCCGEERPGQKSMFEVLVAGTGEGGFVTVRDFVEVVHPWIMGLRDAILAAMGLMNGDLEPLGEETELLVDWFGPARLKIQTIEDWTARENRSRTVNIYQDTAEAAQRTEQARDARDAIP